MEEEKKKKPKSDETVSGTDGAFARLVLPLARDMEN